MVHVYRLSTLLMCFSIIMLHVMGYDGLSQCFLLVWLINRKSMRAVFFVAKEHLVMFMVLLRGDLMSFLGIQCDLHGKQ